MQLCDFSVKLCVIIISQRHTEKSQRDTEEFFKINYKFGNLRIILYFCTVNYNCIEQNNTTMIDTTLQYITDIKGKKISVVLPMKDYKRMLEELEEKEDIRLYDEAKSSKQKYISAEEVFNSIEAKRKN